MKSTRFFLAFISLVTLLSAAGCDSNDPSNSFNSIIDSIDRQLTNVAPAAKSMTSSTTEEARRLFRYEYKVFAVHESASTEQIERILEEAGKERWDCYNTVVRGTDLTFICKRFPYAFLKALPVLF